MVVRWERYVVDCAEESMRDYCCRLIVAVALATMVGLCPAVADAQEILRGGEVIRTTRSVSHQTGVIRPVQHLHLVLEKKPIARD